MPEYIVHGDEGSTVHMGFVYALLFPDKLCVVDCVQMHFFLTLEDAWTWLHAKGLVGDSAQTQDPGDWLKPRRQK
ncbi:hypothetical protein NDU88_003574 [Pleurodeles waltl]|uniref:Uncharacterized protein n=1 Tax=Pleurodeles waltl TaxID=8319 RepID=A0AAV7SGC4_PLEWA|nr:hypothetical protein NDU88_003574 [Pleurodeles waltl]